MSNTPSEHQEQEIKTKCDSITYLRQYPRLIGLAGHKQSGKDTVAGHLVQQYGYTKLAFADPLKEALQALFGFTKEQLYDPVLKEQVDPMTGIVPREAMQQFGTDCIRNFLPSLPAFRHLGSSTFAMKLRREVLNRAGPIVVSDVRFPDEVKILQELGGVILQIHRSQPSKSNNNNEKKTHDSTLQHESETYISSLKADGIIHNDSSFEALFCQVDRWMTSKAV